MKSGATLSWIPDRAQRLAADGAVHGRAWTLAQVCEHLALAMEGTLQDPPPGSPSPATWLTRVRRFFMRNALLLSGRFPQGVKAPDFVAPTSSPALDAAIARLTHAIDKFELKLTRPDARWVAHPLLGRMSGGQWRRFHWIHAAHHFAVIESTRGAAMGVGDQK